MTSTPTMRCGASARTSALRNVDAFGQEFDRVREVPELAGKIRKFGNRYYGIRLVASNIAQLQPRRKLK